MIIAGTNQSLCLFMSDTTVPEVWIRHMRAHTAPRPCTDLMCYGMVPWVSSQNMHTKTGVRVLWLLSILFRCILSAQTQIFLKPIKWLKPSQGIEVFSFALLAKKNFTRSLLLFWLWLRTEGTQTW